MLRRRRSAGAAGGRPGGRSGGRLGARAGAAASAPDHPGDAGSARLAAIPWLARRDYASPELAAKLTALGYTVEAVEGALTQLQAERAVDDARYCSRYVSYQANRGQGPVRIRHDLAAVGLPAALIDPALEAEDWRQHCRDVRRRRFGPEIPSDWKEKGRQSKFLQYRGFSSDHIRFALGGDLPSEFDSDDITDD
jgi:regulatory protein